jgi:DnaK suppressor protein
MADIVGWEVRLQEARARLDALVAVLDEHQTGSLKETIGSGSVIDPESGDLAQAMTDQFTNATIASVVCADREQLERALERLSDGTYGTCEDCGTEIPPERLEFRPECTRCVSCQARHERMSRGAA